MYVSLRESALGVSGATAAVQAVLPIFSKTKEGMYYYGHENKTCFA